MTVKQLHEILGKYVDVGAGDWTVSFAQSERFKTRKEYRDPSNTSNNKIGHRWKR